MTDEKKEKDKITAYNLYGITENFRKKIYKKVLNKFGKKFDIPEEKKEEILQKVLRRGRFINKITYAILLVYLFAVLTYNKIGFEKTVIILLTLILIFFRSNK